MTRPLLAFLKQGCLWELMCTKIKNKFVSNLKKIHSNFFQVNQFSIKENWKSLRIKIIFSQKKNISFLFVFGRQIDHFSIRFYEFFAKRKSSWVKKTKKKFLRFYFFCRFSNQKIEFFWSMHRSKRIKNEWRNTRSRKK